MLDTIILAGGFGTRLRSVIGNKQKVAAHVDGIPFIEYLLNKLHHEGIKKVILALGFQALEVIEAIDLSKYPNMQIIQSIESNPLGTGGALRNALSLIETEDALVLNGDSAINFPLVSLINFHKKKHAVVSVLLCKLPDTSRYGSVVLDEDLVVGFQEKVKKSQGAGIINAGVYVISREMIRELPEEPHSLEIDILPKLCGRKFYGLIVNASFIDIGTPEDFIKGSGFVAKANNMRK